jgi:protein SCO1/2
MGAMNQTGGGGRIQHGVARITGSPFFWIGLLFFTFVLPLGLSMLRTPPEPPGVYGRVPPFRLIDQWNRPFRLEDLEGRVWVANFIFTTCGTVCPELTEVMVEVQHRVRNLNDAIHLVSFTVDPEHDSPEVLLEYARSYGCNPLRWSFLTGPREAVDAVVVGAFESAVIRPEPHDPDSAAIVHGRSMVLVDREGWIRGFYLPDEEGIERLLADINYIVNAPPRGQTSARP